MDFAAGLCHGWRARVYQAAPPSSWGAQRRAGHRRQTPGSSRRRPQVGGNDPGSW